MTLLGLDPRDARVLAVLLDEHGHVTARSTHEGTDVGAAAHAATRGGPQPDATGVVRRNGAVSIGAAASVNPGEAIALAEQWSGAAKGARHVVGLVVDATVAAGVVVDGRLFGGAHGLAGAAAWLSLNPVEREDYRKRGCLEAEVGEQGIVRRLVWRVKSGDPSKALDLAGGNLNAITAQHVFEAARGGDGVAVSVVRDTARYIGMAISNLVAILDPDVIVLGGAIAEAGDLLLEPTRSEVSRRVSSAANQQVSVVPAALGDVSAAVGAARAALLAAQ